jgi:hypothetical protein
VVDETGTAGIFAAQDTPLTSGQMYAILVGKNRVIRYMTMEELSDKIPNEFTNYLYGEIPEMPVGNHRVVSNRLYTTKAGKKMSHIILADHTGELLFVMAFPQMYMQSYLHVREGMVVDVVLGETDDGSLFLKEVLK